MNFSLFAVLLLFFVTISGLLWAIRAQSRRFSVIEDQWRERERQLVDRLLRTAHVPPLEVQREKVLKIPDPELTPTAETWVDVAMREDDVMEELEQLYPEAARLGHTLAKERYAKEWARIEKRILEERTPLRVT